MKINQELLVDFEKSNSRLLAVTKYWDINQINDFMLNLGEKKADIIVGFGENRISSIKEKNLDREFCHFIGNIQTKEIKYITQFCSIIHSVDNVKQIKKFEDICSKQNNWVKIFLQINIDSSKPGGIDKKDIPMFLELIDECENISLIGFSAIGKFNFTIEEKRSEFRLLKELRSKYIPNGIISAGTSRDYKIALEEEIEIIRVGKSLVL
ncbi:hypothetical protein CSB07_00395 [Candidatus Gracilibacteria bacterium]|nr:MAG: hypothetical protein CSB07_00395 [Candidatus Gracilibacteria bacterium]PIE85117.1 MAG: hypothetical protein CSA08_03670 [Candidatus Gracilibacteria bacterium]